MLLSRLALSTLLVLLGACPAGRGRAGDEASGTADACAASWCRDAPAPPPGFDAAGGWLSDGNDSDAARGDTPGGGVVDGGARADADGAASVATDAGTGAVGSTELVALDQAFKGNLGGAVGADALCAAQAAAANRAGTYRAFLSAAGRNARDLVDAQRAPLPVVDSKGAQLFASWSAVFSTTQWPAGATIYTFSGAKVDQTTGDWQDGNLWHGSRPDGQLLSGSTCNDWTSDRLLVRGMAGEVDKRELLRQERRGCHRRHAVICVRVR
ncbi:MAG: hypothetical protein KC503_42215 [Myxococcales bacterium]|nr:hypothetical protein [Myxococcales bacterium]